MRRRVFLASLLPVAAIVSSCLGPTQIMADVKTNACSSLTRVDFYVDGTPSPGTSASSCSNAASEEVGTLAIVPSGSIDSKVQIDVVGALNGATCASTSPSNVDPNCIVAKRELAFIPHTRLDLPIFLDSRCAGFPCTDPNTTCVADQSGPHCIGAACDVDGGVPCTADAGTPPVPDVSVLDVLSNDVVSTTCNPYDAGTPLYSWSFNTYPDLKVHEDHEALSSQTLATGNSIVTTSGWCGPSLTASNPQLLAEAQGTTSFDTDTLIFAFAYQAKADGTILQLANPGGGGGFTIAITQGFLNVVFATTQTAKITPFTDTSATADGKWHTFIMNMLTNGTKDGGPQVTSVTFTRDGIPTVVSPVTYVTSPGPLYAGPILGVDQIEFFAP